MIIARVNIRRGVLGVIAAGVLAGVATAIVVLPTAKGEPHARARGDPCTAANLTETISTVNHQISQYLQAHPETNQALADVAGSHRSRHSRPSRRTSTPILKKQLTFTRCSNLWSISATSADTR